MRAAVPTYANGREDILELIDNLDKAGVVDVYAVGHVRRRGVQFGWGCHVRSWAVLRCRHCDALADRQRAGPECSAGGGLSND